MAHTVERGVYSLMVELCSNDHQGIIFGGCGKLYPVAFFKSKMSPRPYVTIRSKVLVVKLHILVIFHRFVHEECHK